MSLPHRPRPVTEIVDASFQLLRNHYWQFVTLAAVVHLPYGVLRLVVGERMDITASSPAQVDWAILSLLLIVSLLMFAALDALLMTAASDAYLEQRLDLGAALRRGARRIPAAIGATTVKWSIVALYAVIAGVGLSILIGVGVAIGGGTSATLAGNAFVIFVTVTAIALLVLVVLYAMARTFAVPAAQILDRASLAVGLKRSALLARGLLRHIGATLALLWGTYVVLISVLNIAIVAVTTPLVVQVVSTVLSVLTYPIVAIVQTLLYYDVRMRKEGFDLELLSRELSAAAALAPAVRGVGEQPAH